MLLLLIERDLSRLQVGLNQVHVKVKKLPTPSNLCSKIWPYALREVKRLRHTGVSDISCSALVYIWPGYRSFPQVLEVNVIYFFLLKSFAISPRGLVVTLNKVHFQTDLQVVKLIYGLLSNSSFHATVIRSITLSNFVILLFSNGV